MKNLIWSLQYQLKEIDEYSKTKYNDIRKAYNKVPEKIKEDYVSDTSLQCIKAETLYKKYWNIIRKLQLSIKK